MDHKLSLGLAMLPLVPAVQAQEPGKTVNVLTLFLS